MSKITLTPHASGTGTLNIAAPNTNSTRTLTLPDADLNLGNVLTTSSSLASANLTGALPAISGAALTGIVTGSLTLLGTLTTTSGTTQTLSGLTLTSYKQIYAVVNKVSGTSASSVSLRLNSVSGPYISPEQSPTQEWSGTCYIDLTSGIVAGVISVYAAGTTDGNPSNDRVYKSVQTTVTTAATSITFAIAGGNFDLGTITVYGVQ